MNPTPRHRRGWRRTRGGGSIERPWGITLADPDRDDGTGGARDPHLRLARGIGRGRVYKPWRRDEFAPARRSPLGCISRLSSPRFDRWGGSDEGRAATGPAHGARGGGAGGG